MSTEKASNIIIVESPSKIKTISKYLDNSFVVLSSMGHVRALPSKQGSVLVDNDFKMIYEETQNVKKVIVPNTINALKKAKTIYLATDPDREGEAIAWHIVELLKDRNLLKEKSNVVINRITFNELTKNAILNAIANPRDINMHLVQAQQSRQALDYLVGFTLSPLLWRKMPGCKSAGRVQSVALRLASEREADIIRFNSQEYWSVDLIFSLQKELDQPDSAIKAKLISFEGKKLEKFSIQNKDDAEKISKVLQDQIFKIGDIAKTKRKSNPSAPFNTSSMQQDASKKLGFSPKKTMQIAQSLYEGVDLGGNVSGLITYMRTDSVSVSKDFIGPLRSFIKDKYGEKYLSKKANIYSTKTQNAQEAHEAIRVTNLSWSPDYLKKYLTAPQYNLYSLVWNRTLASQMSPAEFELIKVEVVSEKATAQINDSRIAFDGYYIVYKDDQNNQGKSHNEYIANLKQDNQLFLQKVIPNQHFTEPPPRFSESSMIKKLEELGIGRPSTYAKILSVLEERGYISIEKKALVPSTLGILLSAFLVKFFNKYVNYEFTANLEESLDTIANGNTFWKNILKEFWIGFKSTIDDVSNETPIEIGNFLQNYVEDELQLYSSDKKNVCSECNSEMVLKFSKFGPFFSCSNYPKCKNNKTLTINKNKNSNDELKNKLLGEKHDKLVYLCKGPYGFYIKFVDRNDAKKIKNCALPDKISLDDITLDFAYQFYSLPKFICSHPTDGKDLMLHVSKIGFYILYNEFIYKVAPELYDKIFDLSQKQALEIINSTEKPLKMRTPSASKTKSPSFRNKRVKKK